MFWSEIDHLSKPLIDKIRQYRPQTCVDFETKRKTLMSFLKAFFSELSPYMIHPNAQTSLLIVTTFWADFVDQLKGTIAIGSSTIVSGIRSSRTPLRRESKIRYLPGRSPGRQRTAITLKFGFGMNETNPAGDLAHDGQEGKTPQIICIGVGGEKLFNTVSCFLPTIYIIV